MQSLINADQNTNYSLNEAGPIIIALAVVIALGGVVAASIAICGWRGTKSVGFNGSFKSVAITCR